VRLQRCAEAAGVHGAAKVHWHALRPQRENKTNGGNQFAAHEDDQAGAAETGAQRRKVRNTGRAYPLVRSAPSNHLIKHSHPNVNHPHRPAKHCRPSEPVSVLPEPERGREVSSGRVGVTVDPEIRPFFSFFASGYKTAKIHNRTNPHNSFGSLASPLLH